MDASAAERGIREILHAKNYGLRMPEGFSRDEPLFLHGIIDSFGLFAFITALQERFRVRIDAREIHLGNFETIAAIARFVAAKTGD